MIKFFFLNTIISKILGPFSFFSFRFIFYSEISSVNWILGQKKNFFISKRNIFFGLNKKFFKKKEKFISDQKCFFLITKTFFLTKKLSFRTYFWYLHLVILLRLFSLQVQVKWKHFKMIILILHLNHPMKLKIF